MLTPEELDAIALLARDPLATIRAANDRIFRSEVATRAAFFAGVERQPLTQEQALAVVAFDSRVRVIAAAGSGKTSVMVARAAYAVARGFVAPDRILMLAFNADAAAELQVRMSTRLATLGLPTDGLRASTFHSFGRSLIGQATGRKPTIAPWVESGADVEKISQIVDELRDASPDFRYKWDMFRLLYSRVSESPDGGEHDTYDRSSSTTGFHTYRGETVRSEGERMIADWLYLNGVDYRYEQPYVHDVADKEHSQYRPDFFYPEINVWHEHWALGADGTPPASFPGYADGMRWKRSVHGHYGTPLIETTWHEIVNQGSFPALAEQLTRYGLALDWNPDRPIPGAAPVTHERLARLMRTFMSHVKAGSLTRIDLALKLVDRPSRRSRLFLDLFWQIFDRWQKDLAAIGAIDFDDMILQAADLLEQDPSLRAYDLVLVDEFQDTSRSRARMVRALCARPETYLLAVGDDWQAINRFAGADLSAMTDFDRLFGPATTLRLQTTFRNTQRIADVAGRFISRNPAQLHKQVVATSTRSTAAPVVIVRVSSREQLQSAIEVHLHDLTVRHPGKHNSRARPLPARTRPHAASRTLPLTHFVPDRPFVQGSGSRSCDPAKPDYRHLRLPEPDRRRPGAHPGHGRGRPLRTLRGATAVLRGADAGTADRHDLHRRRPGVALRRRTPGRPRRGGAGSLGNSAGRPSLSPVRAGHPAAQGQPLWPVLRLQPVPSLHAQGESPEVSASAL